MDAALSFRSAAETVGALDLASILRPEEPDQGQLEEAIVIQTQRESLIQTPSISVASPKNVEGKCQCAQTQSTGVPFPEVTALRLYVCKSVAWARVLENALTEVLFRRKKNNTKLKR